MVGFAARNTYHFPDASVVDTGRDVREMLIEELRNRTF
jgi:hypothetical protein